MKCKLNRTLSIQLCSQVKVKPAEAVEGRVVTVTEAAGELLVSRGLAEVVEDTQKAVPASPQAKAIPPAPTVKTDAKDKSKNA